MNYLPHTEGDRRAMLDSIGLKKSEELYSSIPKELKIEKLDLPAPKSEWEVTKELSALAAKNRSASQMAHFIGAGSYHRFIPSAVDAILSRSEYYTAYTPYQPEISQGTLQGIYEFQSMMCLLTGMDVSNASMYDGASAAAEAALMATRATNKKKILVSTTLHPEWRQVISTYAEGMAIEIEESGYENGLLSAGTVEKIFTDDFAGLVLSCPNFFGGIEDLRAIAEIVHAKGGLLIVAADPVALALLEAPGNCGADIVVGDGQSLGSPMSFGGPSFGFMTTKDKLARQLPGRIVGATVDSRGEKVYTLTLQTREQHIRREKATSNICSNQGLNALAATMYLSLLGKEGLRQVANLSIQGAHHLADRIAEIPGMKMKFDSPFFQEFVVQSNLPLEEVFAELEKFDVLPGVRLETWYPELKNCFLTCVTETNSEAEIERFIEVLEGIHQRKEFKQNLCLK
ncbi:MAG TPA: aminomethyl-transferring glycine dehydrogenase subunit GcvPA [Chroococcales cyanobacterium]|jgi:glycine dehydrogenase subunit 1